MGAAVAVRRVPLACDMVYMPRPLQLAVARALFAAGRPEDHAAFVGLLVASGAAPIQREPAQRADAIFYNDDPLWRPIPGERLE